MATSRQPWADSGIISNYKEVRLIYKVVCMHVGVCVCGGGGGGLWDAYYECVLMCVYAVCVLSAVTSYRSSLLRLQADFKSSEVIKFDLLHCLLPGYLNASSLLMSTCCVFMDCMSTVGWSAWEGLAYQTSQLLAV